MTPEHRPPESKGVILEVSATDTNRPRRRASMSDVGRTAHVSAQTVSRYYTGGYVSPETRLRIESAVEKLGYRHNRLPRIMLAETTDTVGFLSMGPLNYGNSGIMTGIGRAARAEGQTLITTQIELDPASPDASAVVLQALESLLSMRVDGIIVGTPYLGLETVLSAAAKSIPIISLSEEVTPGVDSVHADSYGAARLAMRHLIALGHERILHLAGPANRTEAAERERGYRDALAEADLTPLAPRRCDEWDAASGARCANGLDLSTFTAVFAANDEIALGFMSELRKRGHEATRDYSIIGIDDMPESQYFAPPLTSARLDFEQLGEVALYKLLHRVRDSGAGPHQTIASTLTVRESTAEPDPPFRTSKLRK